MGAKRLGYGAKQLERKRLGGNALAAKRLVTHSISNRRY